MNWQDAVKENGFAQRTMSTGNCSVKMSDGRQWTADQTDDGVVLTVIPERYWHHADKAENWMPMKMGTQLSHKIAQFVGRSATMEGYTVKVIDNNVKTVPLYTRLKHIFAMKKSLATLAKAVGDGNIADAEYLKDLDRLIEHATEYKKLLTS